MLCTINLIEAAFNYIFGLGMNIAYSCNFFIDYQSGTFNDKKTFQNRVTKNIKIRRLLYRTLLFSKNFHHLSFS